MANTPDYRCTRCHQSTPREELSVKRVQFVEMGEGAQTLRSKVVAWLCSSCVTVDVDWIRPRFEPPRIELTNAG